MEKIFKGKKVLIMGLGLHGGGAGAAKFFCKQGADVLVTDSKSKQKLKKSLDKLKGLKIKYSLAGHKEGDFLNSDLIIKNPDVPSTSPYLEIARKNNITIETDVSLFFKLSKAFVIGVTGSKGKSTTASLIFHMLKGKYKRLFFAGNIGVSPLELLPKIKTGDKVILELSSFELEDMKQSPNIAVITNILPDHLNRYASMTEYINSKKSIFRYQTKRDALVLNGDDPIVRQFAKEAQSTVYFFSADATVPAGFKLLGKHNIANLSAAVTVAKIMKVSDDKIKKAVKTFEGVHSRQEFIRQVGGVKYFNDTTATMPDAAIEGIRTFKHIAVKNRLILIAGGQNKGLDFKNFAREILNSVDELILLPGSASDEIRASVSPEKVNVYNAETMQSAVKLASKIAKPGDIVLLSPAAASFNLFKNEFDRGSQFNKAVRKL